jgi:transposase
MPRHRHDEWLRFLKRLHRETPKNLALHIICDNYATHKHPAVMEWLEEHKRVHIHFTPTSSSWLNMVERFFRSLDPEERMRSSGDITENRIRRGVFRSVPELEAAIQTPASRSHSSRLPQEM